MKLHIFAMLCFVLLVSCSHTQKEPLNPQPTATPAEKKETLTSEQLAMLTKVGGDYRLGGGDVVRVLGSEIAAMDRSLVLGPDGKVTVPEVGIVDMSGLTREEAAKRIADGLKQVYKDPKITLLIETYNNNNVSVLGSVQTPGQYSFPGQPTMLTALAKAGGLSENANPHGCSIVRGRNAVIEIDLDELLHQGNIGLNIPLLPNDVVYIDKGESNKTFFVLGEVRTPGVYPKGIAMDPVRAVALAGGYTVDAQLSKAVIVRRNGTEKPTVFKINLDAVLAGNATDMPPILPGDILFVPRKGIAQFGYYMSQLTPSINTILLGLALRSAIDN